MSDKRDVAGGAWDKFQSFNSNFSMVSNADGLSSCYITGKDY